eukprot:TRINITY_DN16468_c0_g2_i1.p1 TRINITY_DN16468_c0_g2~~TRINITY_DN16468_c0_g2_i1.p1  ORF type:complete len:337 (-),score=70.58 TRINITY_DN16468_c0_g2_i1:329-1339(-)
MPASAAATPPGKDGTGPSKATMGTGQATSTGATPRGATLRLDASATPGSARGKTTPLPSARQDGVTTTQLMLFVFPSSLEHPESTGRLELFARYGPVDEDGKLRGGISGSHSHTDLEIRQMIRHETREMLFSLFKKPRETVEVIVDGLMPAAMEYNYTWNEVKQLLKPCFQDAMNTEDGKLRFRDMQQIILESQKTRLQALIKEGRLTKERGPKVPFQSRAAQVLAGPLNKKKLNDQEGQRFQTMRLHRFGTLVAGLEDQNLQAQVSANVVLCRNPGDLTDRWDRYCAVRRVGKASYVKARNEPHAGVGCMDDGLANKHPGISSLVSAGYAKGPSM